MPSSSWRGSLLIALAVVAAVRLDERRLAMVDTALLRISAILVAVTARLHRPVPRDQCPQPRSDGRAAAGGTTTTADKRDVYWLVFDRYGSDRALELQYGVKNDLSAWLEERGFTVLPDSHANYIRTVLSMSSTLAMAPLDELATAMGPDSPDLAPVNDALQDPIVVARQFKALGYRYFHVGSWWDPTRIDAAADVELTASTIPGTGDFADALYDASAMPAIARRLGIPVQSKRDRQYRYSLAGLDALASLRDEPGPKFVQAHVLLPHPPLVFDRDGSFIDDRGGRRRQPDDELYRRQLEYTNTRIKAILHGPPGAARGRAADHHPPGRRGSLAAHLSARAQDRRPTGPRAPPSRSSSRSTGS